MLDTNKKAPAIPPTITITDAETKEEATNANIAAADARADVSIPGGVPDGPTPAIPEWYKAGWRAVGWRSWSRGRGNWCGGAGWCAVGWCSWSRRRGNWCGRGLRGVCAGGNWCPR